MTRSAAWPPEGSARAAACPAAPASRRRAVSERAAEAWSPAWSVALRAPVPAAGEEPAARPPAPEAGREPDAAPAEGPPG